MARPISEFISVLQNKGMRIQNMWEAEITTGYSDVDAKFKNITFYIEGFTAPARQQETVSVAFKGYPLNVPSKITMTTEHALKVRCDIYGDTRRLFLKWMNYISAANISQGSFFGGEKRIPRNAIMRLKCLAGDMTTVLETIKIYGCIPTSVGDLEMSNTTEVGIATFDVKIVSQYWEVESTTGDFPEQK
jgi:hypothetical protein